MLRVRVIPVLLLKNKGLVKTVSFKNPTYIGDPINAVRIFNEKEVDELMLLDITASVENREPNYAWIKDISSESFMPIGYGGGIQTLDQIKKLFNLGVEKVVLNSASTNLELIRSAAAIFGSQSIVVSIDVKKSFWGKYEGFTHSGSKKLPIPPLEHAINCVNAGAGEIYLQSIDKEGHMKGYDLDITRQFSNALTVPVVASGGAADLASMKEVISFAGASAVSAGSIFVYKGKHKAVLINYPSQEVLKEYLP
ncbi:imidazole glycerol phosphate synthase subunit HisF [Chitinophaga alhagiae]|uniref:imidazole glycerol-phosphate synthase n=1 Tax=Chitinophaga alhagiae TaxID=2203219 RepID=A0ABN5LSN9_9BACT|nr:AglZ/HisF2 family acetamidino modification protein [Chitinophaga alhagiae]AWO01178.1 imidazole glycerol phosphate synthase subunit HisF [Chitinophaga alhagiae]